MLIEYLKFFGIGLFTGSITTLLGINYKNLLLGHQTINSRKLTNYQSESFVASFSTPGFNSTFIH
jgi:hypothetical protein